MMYKIKVAVCSDIRTEHWKQSEGHVEFLNVKPWWYEKKLLGVKRLMYPHREKSSGERSGLRGGQGIGPPLPIQASGNLSFKFK
jgi:hypothetical protein